MDLRGDQSLELQFQMMMKRAMSQVHTSVPGVIISFDPATQTATVQSSVKKYATLEDTKQSVVAPQIVKCPVVVPHSQTAGFAVTTPVKAGDAVLLLFAETSIDNWQERGGPQEPVESTVSRQHDITDCIALVGLSPAPSALPEYSVESIAMRDKSNKVGVEVWGDKIQERVQATNTTMEESKVVTTCGSCTVTIDSGGTVTIAASSKIVLDAPVVEVSGIFKQGTGSGAGGTSTFNGGVRTTLDMVAGGISGMHHTHSGVEPGSGNTQEPQ